MRSWKNDLEKECSIKKSSSEPSVIFTKNEMDESTIIFGRLYCDKMFDTYTDIVSAVIGDINKNRHSDRN